MAIAENAIALKDLMILLVIRTNGALRPFCRFRPFSPFVALLPAVQRESL